MPNDIAPPSVENDPKKTAPLADSTLNLAPPPGTLSPLGPNVRPWGNPRSADTNTVGSVVSGINASMLALAQEIEGAADKFTKINDRGDPKRVDDAIALYDGKVKGLAIRAQSIGKDYDPATTKDPVGTASVQDSIDKAARAAAYLAKQLKTAHSSMGGTNGFNPDENGVLDAIEGAATQMKVQKPIAIGAIPQAVAEAKPVVLSGDKTAIALSVHFDSAIDLARKFETAKAADPKAHSRCVADIQEIYGLLISVPDRSPYRAKAKDLLTAAKAASKALEDSGGGADISNAAGNVVAHFFP